MSLEECIGVGVQEAIALNARTKVCHWRKWPNSPCTSLLIMEGETGARTFGEPRHSKRCIFHNHWIAN